MFSSTDEVLFFSLFVRLQDYVKNIKPISMTHLWILLREILFFQGTDIYEFVQFGPDPNKNLDLVNLNVS